MTSKDSHLYQQRSHKLSGGKEISSSSTLSFTSQLSSLINTQSSKRLAPKRKKGGKEDIFHTHIRNTAKRAKRDNEDSAHFEQKHTTNGETLDSRLWERSKRKMEEKARLYAAMKRGDVEDVEEKYAVDFDRKWAETERDDDDSSSSDNDGPEPEEVEEKVQYLDEFGRTRTGTRSEAARMQRILRSQAELESDRFTARPSAPSKVIYGDAIQHQAFNPDDMRFEQMEELARKRDKSLTPPPEEHFDGGKEVRGYGTGFFQFSGDAEERAKQMEGLEQERAETERRRREREGMVKERKKVVEERRREILAKRGKRKADNFLEELGEEMSGSIQQPSEGGSTEVMDKIEAALEWEGDGD